MQTGIFVASQAFRYLHFKIKYPSLLVGKLPYFEIIFVSLWAISLWNHVHQICKFITFRCVIQKEKMIWFTCSIIPKLFNDPRLIFVATSSPRGAEITCGLPWITELLINSHWFLWFAWSEMCYLKKPTSIYNSTCQSRVQGWLKKRMTCSSLNPATFR